MDATGRIVHYLGYNIFVLSSGYPIGKMMTLILLLLFFFNLSQLTFAGRQGCVLYSSISVFAVDHIVRTRSHPTGRFERHQIFHLSRVASPARPQGLGRCGYPDVLWPRTRLGWPCEYVQLQ